MSKSSVNGVSPLEVIDKYGADATRLHVHFLAGYEDSSMWTYNGVDGIVNFLDKVWKLQDMIKGEEVSKEHETHLNALLKKVEEDYENVKLNTAISAFMIFIKKIREDGWISREEYRQFLIALNPLAPHITSEIFERVFGHDILDESFPEFDESKTQSEEIEIPVQVLGKLRCTIKVKKDIDKDSLVDEIKASQKLNIDFDNVKKVIYVPNKIINFIV